MFRKKNAKSAAKSAAKSGSDAKKGGARKRQVIKSDGGGKAGGRGTGKSGAAMLKEFFFGGVRLVVTLVIAGVIVVLFGSRLIYLQGQADASKADGEKRRAATEDKQLFYDLLRVQLLVPRKDGGLTMRPSDYLMVKAALKKDQPPPGVNRAEQGRFLRLLYNSPAGVIVRQQVRLWNDTRRIAGIRDNRNLGPSDKNKVFWRAFTPNGHPIATGALMPESFGFVQGSVLSTGFGEWVTVPKRLKPLIYRTRVPAGQGRSLTIQVVGNPIKLPRGAKVSRVKLEKHKKKSVKYWPCEIPMQAANVTVPLTGKAQQIEVTVQPAVNCSPIIFGLAIRLVHREQMKNIAKKVYQPGKGMVTVAAKDEGKPEKVFKAAFFGDWYFAWREVKRAKKAVTGGAFTIRTRDGQLLTDNSGKGNPTELTYDMGMVSLIGFGINDAASLAGLLRQSRIPPTGLEVTLTIDGRIQRIVSETMRHYFTKVFRGTRFDKKRKGAVILMDAETGAILAIGGWPLPQRGATSWDYTSFAVSNPNRDPMAIMAWEVIDGNNTPGSSVARDHALQACQADADHERPDARRIPIDLWHQPGHRRLSDTRFAQVDCQFRQFLHGQIFRPRLRQCALWQQHGRRPKPWGQTGSAILAECVVLANCGDAGSRDRGQIHRRPARGRESQTRPATGGQAAAHKADEAAGRYRHRRSEPYRSGVQCAGAAGTFPFQERYRGGHSLYPAAQDPHHVRAGKARHLSPDRDPPDLSAPDRPERHWPGLVGFCAAHGARRQHHRVRQAGRSLPDQALGRGRAEAAAGAGHGPAPGFVAPAAAGHESGDGGARRHGHRHLQCAAVHCR
jgi:hypothetical protein